MTTLTLIPTRRAVQCACFTKDRRAPVAEGAPSAPPDELADVGGAQKILAQIVASCAKAGAGTIGRVAIRVPAAGPEFRAPILATRQTLDRLASESNRAPLHLPVVRALATAAALTFGRPAVLLFETAFFSDLPARETGYALPPDLSATLALRRSGYHGLFHDAACAWGAARLPRETPAARAPRILSVCLDRKPEIAGVVGRRPLMVTSGATPLEGLPGETSCGELDPSIVMAIAEKRQWGPEQVSATLTTESGLLGLAGRRVILAEALDPAKPDLALAREVMRHRIRLAAGAAMAAMGGVDLIVFSGRYAAAGKPLGPWLAAQLTFPGGQTGPIPTACFPDSLPRVMADAAAFFTS